MVSPKDPFHSVIEKFRLYIHSETANLFVVYYLFMRLLRNIRSEKCC